MGSNPTLSASEKPSHFKREGFLFILLKLSGSLYKSDASLFLARLAQIYSFISKIVINIIDNHSVILFKIFRSQVLIHNHLIDDISHGPRIGKVGQIPIIISYIKKSLESGVLNFIFLLGKEILAISPSSSRV